MNKRFQIHVLNAITDSVSLYYNGIFMSKDDGSTSGGSWENYCMEVEHTYMHHKSVCESFCRNCINLCYGT
jgi:hypothetical protein